MRAACRRCLPFSMSVGDTVRVGNVGVVLVGEVLVGVVLVGVVLVITLVSFVFAISFASSSESSSIIVGGDSLRTVRSISELSELLTSVLGVSESLLLSRELLDRFSSKYCAKHFLNILLDIRLSSGVFDPELSPYLSRDVS